MDIRAPFIAGFEFDAKCNLICIHCYAKPGRNRKDVSTDEFKMIFGKVVGYRLIDAYSAGEEILIRPDLTGLYAMQKKRRVLLSLLINITMLTEEDINPFMEHPDEVISTTMHGYTEEVCERDTDKVHSDGHGTLM